MKIGKELSQIYTNNIKPTSHKDSSNVQTKNIAVQTDKIELSSFSKEMNRYIELAKSSETDSAEKIARIKAQINEGTYQVSEQQIASALIGRLK